MLVVSFLLLTFFGESPEIKNGFKPKGPPKELAFVEDLRFGGQGDDYCCRSTYPRSHCLL